MFDIYSLCLINDRSRVHSELCSKLLTGFRLLCGGTFDFTPAQRVWAGSKKQQKTKSVCEFDLFRFFILKFLFI